MREILFRGKRVDNGEWETGSLVYARMGTSEEQASIADKMTAYHTPVIPETVGQYTGLTDKNGKKIFEGDILRNNLNNRLAIVNWKEAHTGFTLNMQETVYNFPKIGCELYAIIGNIHDNPELIGGEKNG